ncbi:hypothetical protein M427DRAFT_149653 [Gonapodya prolifera JEL478]|uniref:Tc1-like transposase DDE domain-containing protein n=1 Tax=Gonapodya prolifera (strain JEL478) TaxID=1344416 RepID=A0A138ZYM6_GONPJ|nr:hypothetical protein M427DRAFT_149653 [Gonapodya prolifera JEL478]|eukprot:KXS09604.1 hypothetical protein M427DRAFT_149653 [Gonapodya prolifera JEL478]
MWNLTRDTWIAMDESGFKLDEAPQYGYSKNGQPARFEKPKSKGKAHYSLSLCLRFTPDGLTRLTHYPLDKWTPALWDRSLRLELLWMKRGRRERSLQKTNPPIPRLFRLFHPNLLSLRALKQSTSVDGRFDLALDNARFHKATNACVENGVPTIAETAESIGVNLCYTSPYCPVLNPVEHAFSVIKQSYVRRACPRTEGELVKAVKTGLQALTPVILVVGTEKLNPSRYASHRPYSGLFTIRGRSHTSGFPMENLAHWRGKHSENIEKRFHRLRNAQTATTGRLLITVQFASGRLGERTR